jgi:ubiquinone/menaquinone biosynthesis C-methylase UbiE
MPDTNPIVETYSRLADQYDDEVNVHSCWGRAAENALKSIFVRDGHQVVLDVGCGTGRPLAHLASQGNAGVRFIGLDPAENMRKRAILRTSRHPNVEIRDGSFEAIPLAARSVDYLFSIFAFHWTTDVAASVGEIARVLKPTGEMDLFFIGRNNGREFIRKSTPIFLKYMGPAGLLNSARMRKQLTREAAFQLFAKRFEPARLSVEESYETYYDTLEGHWGWWVRIEGHFVEIPPEKKQQCDGEVREALASLAGAEGIPYTIHQLHINVRAA